MGGAHKRQLGDLVDHPRENLSVEIKQWLDLNDAGTRADVAKELLALANHGGGFLVFGFSESGGRWTPAEPHPGDLSAYSQDTINGIVAKYAEPRFECEVHLVIRTDTAKLHPVVVVPGDMDVPVRALRDGPERRSITQHTYYTRCPGPESAPIRTGRDWDVLLDRCIRARRELLLDRIRDIIAPPPDAEMDTHALLSAWVNDASDSFQALIRDRLSDEQPSRYANGMWSVAYMVQGPRRDLTATQLLQVLRGIQGRETGWPEWWVPDLPENAPKLKDGRIECWLGAGGSMLDAAHSDYWLADPAGKLYLTRGYQEDTEAETVAPGSFLDLTIPVWRVGEALLHAHRFASAISDDDLDVAITARWTGLRDRSLQAWANKGRLLFGDRVSATDTVKSQTMTQASKIPDALPEIAAKLVRPLYEAFDFFEPPPSLYREELEEMRGARSQY